MWKTVLEKVKLLVTFICNFFQQKLKILFKIYAFISTGNLLYLIICLYAKMYIRRVNMYNCTCNMYAFLIFRNQAEMSNACRGTINLANAFIHTQDSCSFVVSNSGTMTFHLKAQSEVERQRWVTALELAKSKAVTLIESGKNSALPFQVTRF